MPELTGSSDKPGVAGVTGNSSQFNGVLGISTANGHSGVAGVHDEGVGNGVYGRSKGGDGVQGWTQADGHGGVVGCGQSQNSNGVYGRADGAGVGVLGEGMQGEGVRGISHSAHGGVVGINDCASDLDGANKDWCQAGYFVSSHGEGVRGISHSSHGGVVGINTAGGVGVYGEGRVAGFFKGDVEVIGSLTVQGINIGGLAGGLQAVEELVRRVQKLEDSVEGIVERLKHLL